MTRDQETEFAGIIEFSRSNPNSYQYCLRGPGNVLIHPDIEELGRIAANLHGTYFERQIRYDPPQGNESKDSPIKYHRLSVIEQHRFEQAALRALRGE